MRRKSETLTTELAKQDDLGTVVRAHIHIEHELHDFIYFAAPSPSHLKSMDRMEFSEKVSLALVLGLNADLKPSLNAIGALRNKFAHQLDITLGEETSKNLIGTLTSSRRRRGSAGAGSQ